MTKEIIDAPAFPSAGGYGAFPYSQAVRAAGLVFVAGQSPFDPATRKILGSTIQEQTRQCLANVDAVLRAAGTSMEKVVSATFFLRDSADFAGMNEEWARWFPTEPPVRQGARHWLSSQELRISISVIAEA